jgi:hypothetical protein
MRLWADMIQITVHFGAGGSLENCIGMGIMAQCFLLAAARAN